MAITHNYTIVVGIDFSALSDRALDQALEVASLHEGSEVHALYVEPEGLTAALTDAPLEKTSPEDAVRKVQERAQQRVTQMAGHLRKRQIRRVVAHLRRGAAAESIARLAATLDADLVVVGSHGHHGLEKLLLGSVAESTARLARCPVWIVRAKEHAAADREPQIEPPCPDCLTTRRESNGAQMWCARHSEHHYMAPHAYHYAADGIYSAETTAYESTPET